MEMNVFDLLALLNTFLSYPSVHCMVRTCIYKKIVLENTTITVEVTKSKIVSYDQDISTDCSLFFL